MCNERTINGKTIREIEAEISEKFSDEDFKPNESDGGTYIPVDVYEQRFNEIFGYLNYDRKVTEARLISHLNSYSVQVTMTITIYDDSGTHVVTKSANGARPLIIVNDTGNVKSYKSDMAAAESDAFKQICKSGFGMGAEQLRENSKYKKGSAKKGDTIDVLLRTSFQNRGNRLTAGAVRSDTGDAVEVVIFEKNYPEIEKQGTINEFIRAVTAGKRISFTGRYNTYNSKSQAIFESNLRIEANPV